MISKEYPCVFRPFQLLTLWDMITTFQPNYFFDTIQSLKNAEDEFREIYEADNKAIISDEDCQRIKGLINVTIDFCGILGMNFETVSADVPILKLYDVRARITGNPNDGFGKTYLGIYNDFKVINEGIRLFLRDKIFLYLPTENVKYYDREDLFGIADKFPEANKEITWAGNCYATGNYTACVFHLMRAVEIGAKTMVYAMKAQKYIGRKVKVGNREIFRKKPIELCDWGTLMGGLNKAKGDLENGSATNVRKKDTLTFYSHAIAQFGNFKDAWRNKVSHSQETYQQGQATDIMNNTKHFIQHLAQRLKEKA